MLKRINEDSRNQLLQRGKSGQNYKDTSKGKNRYERRTKSRISNSVKEYNKIDMNKFFDQDILDFSIKVNGETNDYLVSISFADLLETIKKETKNSGKECCYATILKSVIKCFNQQRNIYVRCSCLHPDTKIKLLDGSCPTVEEMCKRFESGEQLYVYSVDSFGDFKPGVVEKVWKTSRRSDFIKVTLDNDEQIITTPEHPYMLRTGQYIPADELGLTTELQVNHKIINIEYITLDPTDVYDIKVKDFENFVTNAGVVLHNCPDWSYRFGYFAALNNITFGEKENRPSKITNPDDALGPACKHVLLVLSNTSWINKISSTIWNYICYIQKHYENAYAEKIYPKIYGKKYEDDVQLGLFDNDADKSDSETIDKSNAEGKDRGKFKQGNKLGNKFTKTMKPMDGQQKFNFDNIDDEPIDN